MMRDFVFWVFCGSGVGYFGDREVFREGDIKVEI